MLLWIPFPSAFRRTSPSACAVVLWQFDISLAPLHTSPCGSLGRLSWNFQMRVSPHQPPLQTPTFSVELDISHTSLTLKFHKSPNLPRSCKHLWLYSHKTIRHAGSMTPCWTNLCSCILTGKFQLHFYFFPRSLADLNKLYKLVMASGSGILRITWTHDGMLRLFKNY